MSVFFLVPLFASLANVSCFIENITRDHRFHRLLSLFYFTIGIQNAATAALCFASDETTGLAFWIFQCHSFFLLAPVLVAICSFCTGRRLLNQGTISIAVYALAVDLLCSSMPKTVVYGFTKFSFGMAPLVTQLGGILGGSVHFFAIALSLYFVLFPLEWNSFFERRTFLIALCVWWFGLFSNFLPMYGFDFPPLHPVVDATLSVLLSIYLNRFNASRPSVYSLFASILISLAVGLLFGIIVLSILPVFVYKEYLISIVTTLISLLFFAYLLKTTLKENRPNLSFSLPLENFGLSKQELRICELIAEGHSRSFIRLILNVSDGTLRNHLKNIYGKVLPESNSTSKDQLQRLTVFLSKQKIAERQNI
ncbi:LuxR family transcriptional regulator [Leptospira bourretii]|uniref:LuxR family transcriptional regulator n=1 Tax=Leptospira bourretii TaxID=2484962 RepID=A0A4R9IIH9_9LEPT|nr:LuxR family transcriptional regulator [Leptospira bourretii]TGK88297.1 LuxR family transcriptional regulator [Leptospira bourretii]TGK88947.1 LuxR family transcriptional regulator [Leptospira bourretii]TGL21236.1 LuxR family transcriptional regulator [Leptospira bourretii]TGL37886.1 LuxR family transcriptional regulator [Leptospira bourretii]